MVNNTETWLNKEMKSRENAELLRNIFYKFIKEILLFSKNVTIITLSTRIEIKTGEKKIIPKRSP